MQLTGIHHLTAVTADAPGNHDYYTRTLGMRLVKKTVNQDDTSAYHLFYADGRGSPGTDITFFDWPAARERRGSRSVVRTGFRVPSAASLDYWAGRLGGLVVTRDGRPTLDFEDPEGQRLMLVVDDNRGSHHPWDRSPVPAEHQIRGLGPITISVPDLGPTDRVLTTVMNMRPARTYPLGGVTVHVYEMGDGGPAAELHVAVEPGARPNSLGAGGVHHVAFRVPTFAEYDAWADRLQELRVANSGPVDRFYFRSLYFREPNGVLFELATDEPGFHADEPIDQLGERLSLPPFLESQRGEHRGRAQAVVDDRWQRWRQARVDHDMTPIHNAVAACVLVVAMTCGTAAAAPGRPPNVLFVLIDDMGYGDLTCYGNARVHTRALDQLAAEGIRFTQFYVNAPICSPSRTALLTGQYPARWRMTSYLDNRAANRERGMAQWLDPAAPTVARELHAAGYATGHFGKWHMGGQRDVGDAPLLTEYGFDKTLTTFEGLGDRILPLLDAYDGTPPRRYALGSDTLGRGNITWMERSKVTGGFVAAASAFIRQAQKDGKPFYVNVWPDDVHSPFFPPKDLRGNGTKRQRFLGVVQSADDQLKPLFDLVRNDPALRDNTLIVVASDNGPEPGAGSPGPFRGHKGNLYEGGVREPFITWGPGLMDKAAVGTTDDKSVVAGVDLLPSLLAIAGRQPPAGQAFDGEDQSGAMLGRSLHDRTKPLMWLRPPDRPGPAADPWPDLAIRQGDWKLLVNADGSSPQLYDLAHDAAEKANVAAAHPDVVAAMTKPLLAWYHGLPVTVPPRPKGGAAPQDVKKDEG